MVGGLKVLTVMQGREREFEVLFTELRNEMRPAGLFTIEAATGSAAVTPGQHQSLQRLIAALEFSWDIRYP
jgi:hypothetical protein